MVAAQLSALHSPTPGRITSIDSRSGPSTRGRIPRRQASWAQDMAGVESSAAGERESELRVRGLCQAHDYTRDTSQNRIQPIDSYNCLYNHLKSPNHNYITYNAQKHRQTIDQI